jgi:hypothetical protein
MLEGHHLFWANRASDEPNTFTLRLGQLITEGAKVRCELCCFRVLW